MDIVNAIIWSAGVAVFIFGLQSLVFLPLTIWYEIWKRRFFRRFGDGHAPFVSVIVPAYNEERSIGEALGTMLSSEYPAFEIIVVDDGSTDRTGAAVLPFLADPRVAYHRKTNGGKASALNFGIAASRGEVIFYTDADTLFEKNTIRNIARWFADPGIDAVCGDDTPLRPATPLQKLLAITTHIGSGFVRRAFSVLGVMPIISGNCGAVRSSVLRSIGGFREGWGEDLDLTFLLQRAHARIIYDWEALVHCESPSTFGELWKQRVRWVRSYLKISKLHSDLYFNRAHAPFSLYLPMNWFNLVAIPLLQLIAALSLPFVLHRAGEPGRALVEMTAMMGYLFFFAIAVYSSILDRKPSHLKYLPLYGWLIIPYSYLLDGVVCYSIYKEWHRTPELWQMIARRPLAAAVSPWEKAVRLAFRGTLSIGVVGVILYSIFFARNIPASRLAIASEHPMASMTVATHFDAWDTPGDAVTSILARNHSAMIGTIAIGAGRYEWNYFRWKGHEETWSNHQKGASSDLLGDAIALARSNGRRAVAIVDFYAPKYIGLHPDAAATGSDGAKSEEQVCFTELIRGSYGSRMKEMISYLARNYDLDAISLTELDSRRYCYDDRCLASFTASTGRRSWPKTFFGGDVDKESRALGEWRSAGMALFLKDLADTAHAYGKKLYIDVPVDYEHIDDEGLYHGLNYPRLLGFADALIVWDYFYLEGRDPSTSEDVAKFFISRYDPAKIIFSVGLWGTASTVGPAEFADALRHELLGGARQIWITPNHLVSDAHWKEVVGLMSLR